MRTQRKIETVYDIQKMMSTIHQWLNYTHQVSRIDLLAESSLRFPIMEYLERNTKNQECYLENIYNNFIAEKFKNEKYVDVMWGDRKMDFLMELKYVSQSTNFSQEKQRYFDDIVRMALALKFLPTEQKKRKCFFLVCGKSDLIKNGLRGFSVKDSSKANTLDSKQYEQEQRDTTFNKWLNCEDHNTLKSEEYKEIKFQDKEIEKYFSNFIKKYFNLRETIKNKDDLVNLPLYKELFPNIIYTKQVYLMEGPEPGGQTLGLWEISLRKQRNRK